jgi:hypothetical protein
MYLRFAVVAAAALLTASCVTSYKEPPAASPFATVVFKTASTPAAQEAARKAGLGAYQEYGMVEGLTCKQYARTAQFLYSAGANQPRRVPAGATAYIVGQFGRTRSGPYTPGVGGSFTMGTCYAMAEFKPVAGHTYDVAVDEGPGGCALSAIDTGSGKAPDDLTVHSGFNCPYITGHD